MRWALVEDAPAAEEEAPEPSGRFHCLIAVEDVWSGDGRQFTQDSLTWRDLPLPLMALDQTTEYHLQAVLIGNIDTIQRQGAEVHGWGAWIAEPDAEAANLIGLVERGELRGISADVDAVEYEIILPDEDEDSMFLFFADGPPPPAPGPEPEEGGGTDEEECPEGQHRDDAGNCVPDEEEPEGLVIPMHDPQMRITEGRIMGATVVPFPALQECFIEPGGAPPTVMVASAAAIHHTGITDEPWDAAANEGRLASPMSLATARSMYAWINPDAIDGDEVPKAGGSMPHHMVGDNGAPGVANVHALASAIGALHGGRGGTSIPEADRKATYDHLAAHYRDNDLEPPEFSTATVASAVPARVLIPVEPPSSWFAIPRHTTLQPIRISDRGRVSGHIAAWGTCHISFPNECREAPRSHSDYAWFHTGEVRCSDGSRVAVGHLSCRGGHADLRLSAAQAQAFYDDTDSVVADLRCGEDEFGIWAAGALRPNVEPADIRVAMASDVSGDWRRLGGHLELIHLSSVNVPGFHKRAYIREQEDTGLVAAVLPLTARRMTNDRVAERIAASIGRDRRTRLAELDARVHREVSA